jgi:integrase
MPWAHPGPGVGTARTRSTSTVPTTVGPGLSLWGTRQASGSGRKVTGRTKTEAKAKLRQLRHELDTGVRSSATYTVGDALDDWLAAGLSGRSERTKDLYRDTVKPLRERLDGVKLKDLTAGDVQATLEVLAERLSTRSLQIIRNCLERAIRHAEIRDLTGRNVAGFLSSETKVCRISRGAHSNGLPVDDIALLVGHKGTATTETVYRKVIVPELRRGAEVMDRLFM